MIRLSDRIVITNDGFIPPECMTEVYLTCKCRKHIKICQDRHSIKYLSFNFPEDWDLGAIKDFSFTVWDDSNTGPESFVASMVSGHFNVPYPNKAVMSNIKSTELSSLTPFNRYFEVWVESFSGNKVLLDKGTYQIKNTRKYS